MGLDWSQRHAIHPPSRNLRGWRVRRRQSRVLFTGTWNFSYSATAQPVKKDGYVRKNGGEEGARGWPFWAMRRAERSLSAPVMAQAGGMAIRTFPLQRLLNVDDFSVAERDLQVLVHIDLFGTQIDDFLGLALDRLHLVDGEAEGEAGG